MEMYVILFLISFFASSLSSVAGFGGAMILLPFLQHYIGLTSAVPVLTIASLFGNVSRVWFGRKVIKWQPVIYFIAGAVPLSILGAKLFVILPKEYISIGVGCLLILIVLLRRLKITSFNFGLQGMLIGGMLTGIISGLAGSAGPLGAAFFLGLDLPGPSYIASEAVTATSMHFTKIFVYGSYSLIGMKELGYGLFTGTAMIAGSWTGKKIIDRLPKKFFIIIVELLLIVSGIQMIIGK